MARGAAQPPLHPDPPYQKTPHRFSRRNTTQSPSPHRKITNRRKNALPHENPQSLLYILAYSLVTLTAIASAIHFVMIKNEQTTLQRAIHKSQNAIKEYGRELKTYEMKCSQYRNRYVIKDRLARYQTKLVLITPGDIEKVEPTAARAQPLAQR